MARSTAFMYMRVAAVYREEVVGAFGMTRLDLGLRYIALTPADEQLEDVPGFADRSAGARRQPKRTIKFADSSMRDLILAVDGQRGKSSPNKGLSALDVALVTRANRQVDRSVGKAAAARAQLRLSPKGMLDLSGIPRDRAAAVFARLAKLFR